MKRAITIFLAGLLCLGGCTTHTTNCQLHNLRVQFVGFDSTDVATIVVKSYYPGTQIIARDSSVILYSDYPNSYSFRGDTAVLPVYLFADTLDKEVILPALSRIVRFSDIVSEPPRSVTTKVPFFASVKIDECWRRVLSYKMDGVHIDVPYEQGEDVPATIHK